MRAGYLFRSSRSHLSLVAEEQSVIDLVPADIAGFIDGAIGKSATRQQLLAGIDAGDFNSLLVLCTPSDLSNTFAETFLPIVERPSGLARPARDLPAQTAGDKVEAEAARSNSRRWRFMTATVSGVDWATMARTF